MNSPQKDILLNLFKSAVTAAQPDYCLTPFLPKKPKGRTIVIGFGKSAGAMAKVVEDHWAQDHWAKDQGAEDQRDSDLTGIVITRYGHSVPCARVKVIEAAHPVPDQAGIDGTKEILELVRNLTDDDLVICLISGGGSSLLIQPVAGVSLGDKQALTTALLRSGATIAEINSIRKCFSQVKGGRLAMACAPAKVVSLIISDVPGDDLSLIASGPTVRGGGTPDEVRAILARYRIALPDHMAEALKATKPVKPSGQNVENILIATPQMSLEAAAGKALMLGLNPMIIGDRIEGESRDVAKDMANLAQQAGPDRVILSGGETTVTIRGDGKGGPNTEFLLSLAIQLKGNPDVYALACDTDGIDGSEDNAGAIITPDTLARAAALNMAPADYLAQNNSYEFFQRLGDLVITGPTLTNVNDFRAIWVSGSPI